MIGELLVRPWRAGDLDTVRALDGGTLSLPSLSARFLTGTRRLPDAYLRMLAEAGPDRFNAAVAEVDGRLVGWLEQVRRSPGDTEADLGALVVDAWQRCGVGGRLLRAAVAMARADGVKVLRAHVAADNAPPRRAIARLYGPAAEATLRGGIVEYLLRTDIDGVAG
ncbi:MAG: GNAT family N-acetyltransferase [Mycobacteriales bacterium]